MNAWKHSLSSQAVFGGTANDYCAVHQFLDSSKLFIYHLKHRALLHHLFGLEMAEQLFGHFVTNSEGRKVPVRDIGAAHLREDLNNRVPTLSDWFDDWEIDNADEIVVPKLTDARLEEFVLRPWMRSGLRSSLIITCSHFGVYLVSRLFDLELAVTLAEALSPKQSVRRFLDQAPLTNKWQFTPNLEALERMKRYEQEEAEQGVANNS